MVKLRYWDANVFLGWFLNEPDKADKCLGVIKGAEEGDIKIVTSAITLVEVIKLKGQTKLKSKSEETIRKFFEQEFISVRVVDRPVAERARDLIWKHNIDPKDAIHVATALKLKISTMDTFDGDLIKLSRKHGKPLLKIGHPDIAIQESLNFEEKEKQTK
jgi:predicted nucleic acid-binding protein